MIGVVMVWAMLGPRSLLVIAMVALALYGRSGVLRSPVARALWPWPTPAQRRPAPGQPPETQGRRISDRTFWFLTILAASAIAAWIVTRTIILGAPGILR